MSIYIKSFVAIKAQYYRTDFLKNADIYFAHTPAESFYEHNNLVIKYFLRLVEEHRLDDIIDKLIVDLLADKINDELAEFVKLLFFNAIAYHDFGKVNENFQLERMKNKNSFFKPTNNGIEAKHSLLSAYIFIVHQFAFASKYEFETEQKILLNGLIYLFSYPILKHHAPVLFHGKNDINFDLEIQENLKKYLQLFDFDEFEKFYNKPAYVDKSDKMLKDKNIESLVLRLKEKPFPLFGLLKLNFSLLTASDYLATSEYMNELSLASLGLIDKDIKKKINDYVKTEKFLDKENHKPDDERKKNYNKETYEIVVDYEFKNPKVANGENLNILRQEMAIEVIQNVRKNTTKNLFYIEAPTGGGKTNLSILSCLELLEQNPKINKVFYVFPFTTLITQTHKAIMETLGISPDEVIQLHSKAGFKTKEETEDGIYGDEKQNFIDNLFVNYPFCLLTHIKFFDILKSNHKETNYLLHRLTNSIVIIDELQSYNPAQWDKIIYFIISYAKYFNIKFVLMSATLPEIGKLKVIKDYKPDFVYLLENAKGKYFQNPNFLDRVNFNFELLDYQNITLENIAAIVVDKSLNYARNNTLYKNSVFTIIEFIFKKTATEFYHLVDKNAFDEVFVLSGTILESRRKEIINFLKNKENRTKKVLLITTQVVEAGVDIDMDLGFKDTSLIDSDEQLAGRINRNVNKEKCELFLFNLDKESVIYKKDKRLEQVKKGIIKKEQHIEILENKNFNLLYDLVMADIDKWNNKSMVEGFSDYKNMIQNLDFQNVSKNFRLIEQENLSIFVPLDIPIAVEGQSKRQLDFVFSENELAFLEEAKIYNQNDTFIDGEEVFGLYCDLIQNRKTKKFINGAVELKVMQGILSKFVFSTFASEQMIKELKPFCRYNEINHEYTFYGYMVFRKQCVSSQKVIKDNQIVYSYFFGINDEVFNDIENQFI